MALEVASNSGDPCYLPIELHRTDHLTFYSFGDFLSSLNILSALYNPWSEQYGNF
jgi:hypothetical protein